MGKQWYINFSYLIKRYIINFILYKRGKIMKKKALVSSILTIALCFSLIGGSTFALFTSRSEINIAATAGTVDVQASVENLMIKDLNEADYARGVAAGETVGFESSANPDTRTITFTESAEDGTQLTLTNIVPGDSMKFDVNVHNNSAVSVSYRIVIKADGELFNALKVSVDGDKFPGEFYTPWAIVEAGSADVIVPVEVTLPDSGNNDYDNKFQGKSCTLTIVVEAVQGNAETVDAITAGADVTTGVNANGSLETTQATTVTANNGFSAEIPAGTALKDGSTTTTLIVNEADAADVQTGNFNFVADGAEVISLDIAVLEVAENNEAPIKITLADFPTGRTGVTLFHDGVQMVPVASAAEVDADGEFFYDATTGNVVLATKSFSNFTFVVIEKTEVATEAELVAALTAGKNVIFTDNITLTKTLLIKKDAIIDLNGYTLDANISGTALLQSSSDTDPTVVINSSVSGAKINAGAKSVILAYGVTEFYNVEINVDSTSSANGAPFNVYNDLTLGTGVVVNVGYLGTALIGNNGAIKVLVDAAEINVAEFKVNAGYMVSLNNASTVTFDDAEFNVVLNPTYPTYFCNKTANLSGTVAFNVTDLDGAAYTVENFKWAK